MTYTGRGIEGPGADLLLMTTSDGEAAVAVAYRSALADRDELGSKLDEVRGFLHKPGVDGLLPVLDHPEPGVFVYSRKGGLTVREVLLAHRAIGQPCGERAGLELLLQGAEVLADSLERARSAGLQGHGDLSPWRLLIDDEGFTDLFGYGLPPLSLLDFLEGRTDTVPDDALRYAPPERLELQAEDVLSDLFSLSLVAVELIAGRPVFDGSAEDTIEGLLSGEAPARIEKLCSDLPDPTLDLLCICCELDPGQRYRDPEEVIRLVKRCLREAEGPSLKGILDAARDIEVLTAVGPTPAEPEPAAEPKKKKPKPRAAAPEPEPEPEPEPIDDDPLAPPPELPPLPDDPDLDSVQTRARDIVAWVQEASRRTTEISRVAKEESAGAPPELASLTRRILDAVTKSEKAIASAKRSAGLVELDEDADDAVITLGLVTGSQQQARGACQAARDWLDELREGMVEVKKSREKIVGFARDAQDAAGRASKALSQAEDVVTELDRGLSGGELSASGVEPAIERAHKALARARAAASKANHAVDQARSATTTTDAKAYASSAKTAGEAVSKAVDEISKAAAKAKKIEAAGLESARAEVLAQATAAADAAEAATKGLERARKAVENGHDDEARALVKRAGPLADKAVAAGEQARAGGERATAAEHSAAARRALVPTRRAAHEAIDASEQAQALCKRAIGLAGAAAQAAEALASARAAASKLVDKTRAVAEQAGNHVDSLVHDTDEVEGADAVAERESAVAALADARDHVTELLERFERFQTIDEPDDAEADLARLKATASAVQEQAELAQAACARCRDLAEDEIREILTERRRLASLERYTAAAASHADQCRQAVDKAWARYRGLPEAVSSSDIREVKKQLEEAYEVIDIAEFQAGEAATAAESAARQGDPAEAAGYAESAASFWERISEDLPEALAAIDAAEKVATAEIRAIEDARARTAKAAESAVASRDAIRAARSQSDELAKPWAKVKAVSAAKAKIRKADAGLDDAVAEAEYARDRARSCDTAADATEMVPVGEGAANKLADLRQAAEAGLAELKKAVQAAQADREEVESLRAEISTLSSESLEAVKKVKACQERLDKALSKYGAIGSAATGWQETLEECLTTARGGRKRTKEAVESIKGPVAAREARTLAERARKGHKAALAQVEPAANAETEGVQAAKAEAESRAAAEQRRIAEAREASAADAQRADEAVAKVVAGLAEMDELLESESSRDAISLRDEVRSTLKRLEKLKKQAADASGSAADAEQADAVLTAALDAREAAQRVMSAGRDALSKLSEARTLALAAAEQQAALNDLREQMSDLASQADASVKLAKEQSGFLDEVLDRARTDATRALRAEADEALASVRKAATKVHTAAPMLAEAESLDVAMHMLKAARRAVDAAADAAAQVPKLVSEAERRLDKEAEDARQALEAARRHASAPLQGVSTAVDEAKALSAKAQPKLTEHPDVEGLPELFAELSAAVATVDSLRAAADEVAKPAADAESVEAAEAIRAQVKVAADKVLAAVEEVRVAAQAFDAAVEQALADRARVEAVHAERAEADEGLRERLVAARAAFVELEDDVDGCGLDRRETVDLLHHVEEALRLAADAVHKASDAAGKVAKAEQVAALDPAEAAAAERATVAEERLDAFDKALADERDELSRMIEEHEERVRQERLAAEQRERDERAAQARSERDALRRNRPGGAGLRPAGPPRGDLPRRPAGRPSRDASSDDASPADARLRRPGSGRASSPNRRSVERSGSSADRRLRRPGRSADADRSERRSVERSSAPSDRRLRRPGADDDAAPADRRLRRPSGAGGRSLRRSSQRDEGAGDAPADRRLRRPGRSGAADDPSDERARRRPSRDSRRSTSDDAPADRRLRRPARDGRRSGAEDAGPAASGASDRRLRRPSRGSQDVGSSSETSGDRDDLRSRLRERRASRMASGSTGGAEESPVRPRPGGPRGRLPSRPGGPPDAPVTGSGTEDEDEELSGADLLKRRLKQRSQGGPPRPTEEPSPRPRRSVDGLMSRIKRDKSDD